MKTRSQLKVVHGLGAVLGALTLCAGACRDKAFGAESSGTSTSSGSSTGPSDPSTTTTGAISSTGTGPIAVCGDGIVEGDEHCDDGNLDDGDGCEATCTPTQRDGHLRLGATCSCMLWDDGGFRCWGDASRRCTGWGDVNIDNIGDDETPADVGDVPAPFKAIDLAVGQHSCAVTDMGAVRCWGDPYVGVGKLGLGVPEPHIPGAPESLEVELDVRVKSVALGEGFTCVITEFDAVRCWGDNQFGQLGYGHTETIGDDETPFGLGDVSLGGPVAQLAAGDYHTCALLADGTVRCWGWGTTPEFGGGMLGYGNLDHIGDDELPSSVGPVDLGGRATLIRAAGWHSCALLSDGAVICWGNNGGGSLGLGHKHNIGDDETPAVAGHVPLERPAIDLAIGSSTCVLLDNGDVRCWGGGKSGDNGYGHTEVLGDDEVPADLPPVDLGDDPILQLAGGGGHVCALAANRNLRCWGSNRHGQLGYGHTRNIGDDEVPADAGLVLYQ